LGAIRHWISLQEHHETIFCVVDLHAVTVHQDPAVLNGKIREVAGLLIAAGIDPGRTTLFVQSDVGAHAELAWILNCVIPMGWMQRMTQFKEKSERRKNRVSVGLFDYPALMAADILLYDTDLVPVGEDQKQHLELTRDVAGLFNAAYGETFKLPDPVIPRSGARIMGLDNPSVKMSKSEHGHRHAINLLDRPDEIRTKISKATTDSLREIRFDENRPGIHNLLLIYKLFTGEGQKAIEARFQGRGYADFKKELAEIVIEGLRPLQSRYDGLMNEPKQIQNLLCKGAERVRPIAEKVLARAKERMGLGSAGGSS
jgi:tryptophanyl-tRNA synthetase